MKIENISMQIKNEKSCARSMSDEDLVRAVRPGLTAVGPFMFHVCNIFSLHVQFLICSNIFNLQVKFLVCSNIFNLHVWPFWATVLRILIGPKKTFFIARSLNKAGVHKTGCEFDKLLFSSVRNMKQANKINATFVHCTYSVAG